MASNRREFLRKSGALCAGLVCLPAMAWEAQADQPAPAAASQSLERWLLDTGQSRMDRSVFTAVSEKLG